MFKTTVHFVSGSTLILESNLQFAYIKHGTCGTLLIVDKNKIKYYFRESAVDYLSEIQL